MCSCDVSSWHPIEAGRIIDKVKVIGLPLISDYHRLHFPRITYSLIGRVSVLYVVGPRKMHRPRLELVVTCFVVLAACLEGVAGYPDKYSFVASSRVRRDGAEESSVSTVNACRWWSNHLLSHSIYNKSAELSQRCTLLTKINFENSKIVSFWK